MSCLDELVEHRRLRAPRDHRTALVEPPLTDVPTLLETNRQRVAQFDVELSGRSLSDLARFGRRELVGRAHQYTTRYRDTEIDPECEPVLLSGHQPELFHPGVWFKNFALSRLGRDFGGAAVQILIDTDTVKTPSIRVPTGSVDAPRVEAVPLDMPTADVPYEVRSVKDRAMLAGFPGRVAETLGGLVADPLVHELWPLVIEGLDDDDRLGACLARGRHRLEERWGLDTLEIPQSEICRFESFRWFTAHLLSEMPRVWEIYNEGIRCYRQANRIRSRNHPAPELESSDDWLEAPFWISSPSTPARRRLFVRQQGDELVLSDRSGLETRLPLFVGNDISRSVAALAELEQAGIRIRSRALITTMFARLVLSDLFLHGIGGGKYDELTDWLVRRLFAVEPPRFMILSATYRLPIEHGTVDDGAIRAIDQQLRDLTYNPDRYVEGDATQSAAAWIEQKQRWVATAQTRENARLRCHAIREANENLQPMVADERSKLRQRREQLARAQRAAAVLGSREYSFCLYQSGPLRDFLLEISGSNT